MTLKTNLIFIEKELFQQYPPFMKVYEKAGNEKVRRHTDGVRRKLVPLQEGWENEKIESLQKPRKM